LKIRLITGISLLIIIIVALLYVFILSDKLEKAYNNADYYLSENEESLLQDGDIILRRGYGLVSKRIVETLKDTLNVSHCGIIVQTDSCWSVVHSIPGRFSFSKEDGVIITPLSEFMEESYPNSVIITRLKRDSLSRIAQKALSYAERKVPFDYDFNYNDTTSLYCSELILHILEDKFALTPEVLGVKTNLPSFSIFTNPDFFEIIIKHHSTF